jgi:hypothetical protein
MTDIAAKLAAPFDPNIVSWRVGPTTKDKTKGMALAYLDARDVMRRLDEVCGPEGWQNEYPWSDGKRVVCRIGIKITAEDRNSFEWIWKSDGAGDSDEEGEKGALSGAFKRAAVHWGIGRYLYDCKTPWVPIEAKGNSYVIPDAEKAKLANLLRRQFPAAPQQQERNATNGAGPGAAGGLTTIDGGVSRAQAAAWRPDVAAGGGAGAAGNPLTPAEAAAHPTERERKVLAAREARKRITEALGVARTPAIIDEVIERNSAALEEIKDLHTPSYEAIMALAGRLKTEILASTG